MAAVDIDSETVDALSIAIPHPDELGIARVVVQAEDGGRERCILTRTGTDAVLGVEGMTITPTAGADPDDVTVPVGLGVVCFK